MKKLLRYGFWAALAAVAAYQVARIPSRIRDRALSSALAKANPAMTVYTLAGDTADIRGLGGDRGAVVVYFSPDCSHCEREARALRDQRAQLDGVPVALLSLEDAATTRRFAREEGLDSLPGFHFYLDRDHRFPGTFGTSGYPVILLYDGHHRLARIFQGETPTAVLARALPDR